MTATAPIVHIVDDDNSFRTSTARLLRASGYQVALYESGDQFLSKPLRNEPGCILLDVQMPGLSGLDLQNRLAQQESNLSIVFLSAHGDIPTSVKAIKAGAADFLPKPVQPDTLLQAVERAIADYSARRLKSDQVQTLRALVKSLSPRQHEVFALIVRGKLNKQIAAQLGTTERTVKAHRAAVMEKLKVGSFAEAVSIAERIGMLEPAKEN